MSSLNPEMMKINKFRHLSYFMSEVKNKKKIPEPNSHEPLFSLFVDIEM